LAASAFNKYEDNDMAKVIVEFCGVPDGEVYLKEFALGDEVNGDLAVVAIREGWAEETETKASKPDENKARKAAPENK